MVKDALKVVKSVTEMAAEPAGLSGVPGLNEGLAGVAKPLQKTLDIKADVEGVEKLNKRIVGSVDNIPETRRHAGNNELLQEKPIRCIHCDQSSGAARRAEMHSCAGWTSKMGGREYQWESGG